MNTYISILRGINVSGKNLIKMEALRNIYENLGFKNVTIYVQSGNVIYSTSDSNITEMEEKIVNEIEKDYGIVVPVMVMSDKKLIQIINQNPFIKDSSKEMTYLHVTFLSSQINNIDIKTIEEKKQENEDVVINRDVVYLYCPNGYGKTKLNNNFLESKLKVTATTRNWKTTNELLRIALEISDK